MIFNNTQHMYNGISKISYMLKYLRCSFLGDNDASSAKRFAKIKRKSCVQLASSKQFVQLFIRTRIQITNDNQLIITNKQTNVSLMLMFVLCLSNTKKLNLQVYLRVKLCVSPYEYRLVSKMKRSDSLVVHLYIDSVCSPPIWSNVNERRERKRFVDRSM